LSGYDNKDGKRVTLCGMLGTARDDSLVIQDIDGVIPLEFMKNIV
jgi:hypothetical protein